MATVLLNEIPISPYLPSLLEQCQQLVGTSQKTWLVDGNFHYKPQNHHVKCIFFKKITINKRTEEQHTTSPIHIFIPDGWFCPDQATGFHPAAKVSCQDLEDEIHRPQKAGAISPSCCQTDFFINIAMLLIVWY